MQMHTNPLFSNNQTKNPIIIAHLVFDVLTKQGAFRATLHHVS